MHESQVWRHVSWCPAGNTNTSSEAQYVAAVQKVFTDGRKEVVSNVVAAWFLECEMVSTYNLVFVSVKQRHK